MAYYLIDFENVKSRGMEGVELLTEEDTVCIFYSDNADCMTFDLHQKLNETKAKIIYHKVAVGTKNALDFQLATYLGYLICEQQREDIHPNYFIVTKDNGFTSLMVYWKAQGVPVRIIRNLLWGKNPGAAEDMTAAQSEPETAESAEQTEWTESAAENGQEPLETLTEAGVTEEEAPVIRETLPTEQTETAEATEPATTEEKTGSEPEETPEKAAEPEKKQTRRKNTRKTTQRKGTGKTAEKKAAEKKAAEEPDELTQAVEKVLSDQTIVPQVVKFIRQYKTKQGINNALNKEFKDSKRTSEIYSAIKPLIADKKGNSKIDQ